MNDQNTTTTNVGVAPAVPAVPPVPTEPTLPTVPVSPEPMPAATRPKKLNLKKVLIICGVALGIIIVIGLVSMLFRGNKPAAVTTDATGIPSTPLVLTEESKTNETKLKAEREETLQIDIYQRYLTPPRLDFDISF